MPSTHSTIQNLQKQLEAQAERKMKVWWENYVKGSAPFRGVKMAAIRKTVHSWHQEQLAGRYGLDEILEIALALSRERHSEDKMAAILLIREILMPLKAVRWRRDVPRFSELFETGKIYDWNICDWFCVKILGPLIREHGFDCARTVSRWHQADNLWQARASVVAFVGVAENEVYHDLVLRSCQVLIRREERFAKTAVGWILREMSRAQEVTVESFIESHLRDFTVESLKNAAKYFDKGRRKTLTDMLKNSRGRV